MRNNVLLRIVLSLMLIAVSQPIISYGLIKIGERGVRDISKLNIPNLNQLIGLSVLAFGCLIEFLGILVMFGS